MIAAFDAARREQGYGLDPDLRIIAGLRRAGCYYMADERVLSMGYPEMGLLADGWVFLGNRKINWLRLVTYRRSDRHF